MSGINHGRLLLGGLFAGLLINIGEFILNVPIAGARFEAALANLGLAPPGGAATGVFVLSTFALGILAVWLYSAVRPRLGAGPRTALVAGLFVWLLACVYPSILFVALGLLPPELVALATVWQMIEFPLATAAGAWLYREGVEAVAARAPANA